MSYLNNSFFSKSINAVNEQGYFIINLREDLPSILGEDLYLSMDKHNFLPNLPHYYNEVALYWPEDWNDVSEGVASFHNTETLNYIYPYTAAKDLLDKSIGKKITSSLLKFIKTIKELIINNHSGLLNNQLKLGRVMIRQMNEKDKTIHAASSTHEDMGYSNRSYQHLLSAIITTYGYPTLSNKCDVEVGELLLFNTFDRRRMLGLPEKLAFTHKGPRSGPKMLLFFEFLGPQDR